MKTLFTITVALTLAACSPMVQKHGHVRFENIAQNIHPGEATRDDVRQMLGTPSSTSSFGEETWYYISSTSHTKGPLKPKITDQTVLAITFDNHGIVSNINRRTTDDRKNINFSDDKTPTEGHDIGVVEQLLGNFGRFNAPPKDTAGGP